MAISSRNLILALAVTLTLCLTAAGCGGSEPDGSHPNYARALAGAPAPLAALHAQANEILPGGRDAFEARLAKLRGYPVVVNLWASWCGSCRYEFSAFQNLSARYGKRVAFLGIDSQDSTGFAKRFLREAPVPYPSYEDGDGEVFNDLKVLGLPATAFYDRQGELCKLKQGAYADENDLEADIRSRALQESCESA